MKTALYLFLTFLVEITFLNLLMGKEGILYFMPFVGIMTVFVFWVSSARRDLHGD